MKPEVEYKIMSAAYFVLTFVLIGFAIVSLVQGFVNQVAGGLFAALFFYMATPFIILASYLTFGKGYHKLKVLARSGQGII